MFTHCVISHTLAWYGTQWCDVVPQTMTRENDSEAKQWLDQRCLHFVVSMREDTEKRNREMKRERGGKRTSSGRKFPSSGTVLITHSIFHSLINSCNKVRRTANFNSKHYWQCWRLKKKKWRRLPGRRLEDWGYAGQELLIKHRRMTASMRPAVAVITDTGLLSWHHLTDVARPTNEDTAFSSPSCPSSYLDNEKTSE